MRVGYKSHHNIAVQLIQKMPYHGGLAGTYITGDDTETRLIPKTIFQQRQGHVVLLAQIKKFRVRQQRKRLAPESIIILVHN